MKKLILIFVSLSTFAIGGTLTYFNKRTDDMSLRYNLWKLGVYPYPSDHIAHAVISDQKRHNLIKGKSKQEILKIFPNAHEDCITEGQKQYFRELAESNTQYLWLGESNVIIYLKDGIGDYINIMKG